MNAPTWDATPPQPTAGECYERAVGVVDAYPIVALAHAAIGILRILLDEES